MLSTVSSRRFLPVPVLFIVSQMSMVTVCLWWLLVPVPHSLIGVNCSWWSIPEVWTFLYLSDNKVSQWYNYVNWIRAGEIPESEADFYKCVLPLHTLYKVVTWMLLSHTNSIMWIFLSLWEWHCVWSSPVYNIKGSLGTFKIP